MIVQADKASGRAQYIPGAIHSVRVGRPRIP